jgi:alkanesulfonate monooxygenase SsuD/methylene tetrahydromethanopterin reductase-like flavin-dependent oxidoreductase (luciferase family)
MKISLFEEIAVPRPWTADQEARAFRERLEQYKLADEIGIHAVWLTEHHFLEEYSHSSAPEVFLGALSSITSRIRLGHGIMHLPPGINHPARVAERVATLDILSGGRVELGTGESSSAAELEGFVLDVGRKREMWTEGMKVMISCLADEPFPGFLGKFVQMPPRNVVPKPIQKPHPPLWVACTRKDTLVMAAENGLGALVFSFYGPEVFEEHLHNYYNALVRAVPLGRIMNANVLCSAGALICGKSDSSASTMLGNAGRFFSYGIRHFGRNTTLQWLLDR